MNKTHRILLKSVSKGLNKGSRDQGILSANSEIESSVPVDPFDYWVPSVIYIGPVKWIHQRLGL